MCVIETVRFIRARVTQHGCRPWCCHRQEVAAIAVFAWSWTLGASSQLHAHQAIHLRPIASATSDQIRNLAVVADAVVGSHGLVFIVDPTAPGVVVTDAGLRPVGTFGRRGSGPGEFREPVSIASLSDERLAVLDRALGRVTIFAVLDGGKSLVHQRTVALRMPSEAMCVLTHDKLLIYGFNGGNRLHLFNLDAGPVRSFAPPDVRLSPMAADLLTQGRIACDRERDEVLVSGRFLPFVEAFRVSTGERFWADTLRPFRAISVADRGAEVTISSGRAGFSHVSSIFVAGDYRVFQTVYESRRDNATADTVVTYIYSSRERAWMPPEFHLPLLYPVGGGMALSVAEGNGPQMEIKLNHLMVGNRAAKARPQSRSN